MAMTNHGFEGKSMRPLVITLTILRSVPLILYEHRMTLLAWLFATLTRFDTKGLDRRCPSASNHRISGTPFTAPMQPPKPGITRGKYLVHKYVILSTSRKQDISKNSPPVSNSRRRVSCSYWYKIYENVHHLMKRKY